MPSNDRNALEAELRRLEKQVEELIAALGGSSAPR